LPKFGKIKEFLPNIGKSPTPAANRRFGILPNIGKSGPFLPIIGKTGNARAP